MLAVASVLAGPTFLGALPLDPVRGAPSADGGPSHATTREGSAPVLGMHSMTTRGGVVPSPPEGAREAAASDDVAFAEVGLAAGAVWWVQVSGARSSSNTSVIYLDLPPGVYVYLVGRVTGYQSNPTLGSMTVASSGAIVSVDFAPYEFPVLFSATGLPSGLPWSVDLGGQSFASGPNRSIETDVPNGSYSYRVQAGSYAFYPTVAEGNVTVEGAPVWQSVVFSARLGHLVGSVEPVRATVALNGTVIESVNGTFSVAALPGSYVLTASLQGYSPAAVQVVVSAGNLSLAGPIVLAVLPAPPVSHPASVRPPPPIPPVEVALVAVALVTAGLLVILRWRRERRRSEEVFRVPPRD